MPLTVAIVGAGPLGRWLALCAARAGYRVLLEDVMPANLRHAQEFLRQQLSPHNSSWSSQGFSPEMTNPPPEGHATKGTGFSPYISPEKSGRDLAPEGMLSTPNPEPQHEKSTGTVAFVSTIEDAVRQADLAIDCVPDELESKLEILWLLDRMAPPRTVLATPTTRLSIADLASCTYRPEKVIAIAAEASALSAGAATRILLRTTTRTSPETVDLLEQFWRRLGFAPTFAPDPAEKAPSR